MSKSILDSGLFLASSRLTAQVRPAFATVNDVTRLCLDFELTLLISDHVFEQPLLANEPAVSRTATQFRGDVIQAIRDALTQDYPTGLADVVPEADFDERYRLGDILLEDLRLTTAEVTHLCQMGRNQRTITQTYAGSFAFERAREGNYRTSTLVIEDGSGQPNPLIQATLNRERGEFVIALAAVPGAQQLRSAKVVIRGFIALERNVT